MDAYECEKHRPREADMLMAGRVANTILEDRLFDLVTTVYP